MESDPLLAESLALKGGTAINLTIFNLPRLSVDIDLDYSKDVSREPMLAERKQVGVHIQKYMEAAGYSLSLKSKQYHALDSYVYEYINSGGMKGYKNAVYYEYPGYYELTVCRYSLRAFLPYLFR